MTYAPGGRTGSWQPWVAMGAAKAALEVLCRYFAVALASRQITVNAISPGWTEDSVLNTLPEAVQNAIRNWHQSGWTPMRKLGTPADPGNAVALLCSAEANWIKGKSWMWMEVPRSWMRTSRWKFRECPRQEAPKPPSARAKEAGGAARTAICGGMLKCRSCPSCSLGQVGTRRKKRFFP